MKCLFFIFFITLLRLWFIILRSWPKIGKKKKSNDRRKCNFFSLLSMFPFFGPCSWATQRKMVEKQEDAFVSRKRLNKMSDKGNVRSTRSQDVSNFFKYFFILLLECEQQQSKEKKRWERERRKILTTSVSSAAWSALARMSHASEKLSSRQFSSSGTFDNSPNVSQYMPNSCLRISLSNTYREC